MLRRSQKDGSCSHFRLTDTTGWHGVCAGVPLKRKLAEFRVTPDALMPVGTELRASHFVAGQYVDVTGITIGKGFQGVMKKWGFRGGPASHGNSLAHRVPGSTGSNQVRGCWVLWLGVGVREVGASDAAWWSGTRLSTGARQARCGRAAEM